MTAANFERLSAIDASFLAMEDGRAHMHLGAVSVYEGGPLRTAGGGLDIDRVVAFIEAQLPKFPVLRRRLARVPLLGQPGWVDDDRFNVHFHVRHTALPPPGDERQLKRLAGRVLSQEFDRAKPLWELWFVEGLDGGRFAVISKMHHCMTDGMAGLALGNLLVGPDPGYEPPPAVGWEPRPAPSPARLVADELAHRARLPFELLRSTGGRSGSGGPRVPRPRGLRGLLANATHQGSATPLNVAVGPHRRFDWTRLPFDDVRRIGKLAGGTVNDVVLAVTTAALREFLMVRGVGVDELDFRAVVPVNMRTDAGRGAAGNRVAELIAHLPLEETDPWKRLLRVVELTQELKSSGQSGAGDLINRSLDLLPVQLVGPLFRMASQSAVTNLIVTNVPGPRVPVYLLGARQLATYPVVPLLAHQALGIALMSYVDGLFWGFHADWDAVPDLHELVGGVDRAFAELAGAAG